MTSDRGSRTPKHRCDDACACIEICKTTPAGLDFVTEWLYDMGYSSLAHALPGAMRPTPVRRRAHPLGEPFPPSASPGSRRSLEENPCPGAMEKWCP
jgi:hypothetical protein